MTAMKYGMVKTGKDGKIFLTEGVMLNQLPCFPSFQKILIMLIGRQFIKPCPCFAWRGFLLCVCLSVRVCVCVSVTKVSKKILNRSTSFLAEAFPLTQGGNHSILKTISPG